MKNFVLLSAIVANTFSFSCFAQLNDHSQNNKRIENTKSIADRISQNELIAVSFHVEERINMRFGSTITTYTVPSLNLVNTHDLGANNKRTITTIYARAKITDVYEELPSATIISTSINFNQAKVDIIVPEKRKTSISVNVLETYERVLENGYFSVEMLKKVGDWRYFDGDLELAAKWYAELFCMTTDLEVVFYYRYAQSLKFIGQTDKANEMMAIFESKR